MLTIYIVNAQKKKSESYVQVEIDPWFAPLALPFMISRETNSLEH
jgi:hypothetical protein